MKPDKADALAAELVKTKSETLKLRAQVRRVEEVRDIQSKASRHFSKEPK